MLGFLKILDAIFIPPAGNILNDRTFCERNVIRMDVFNRLNLELLVVIASNLNIKRRTHSISPWLRTRV